MLEWEEILVAWFRDDGPVGRWELPKRGTVRAGLKQVPPCDVDVVCPEQ